MEYQSQIDLRDPLVHVPVSEKEENRVPSRSSHLPNATQLVENDHKNPGLPTLWPTTLLCPLPAALTSCDLHASSVHCKNPHIVATFQGSRCCHVDVHVPQRPKTTRNQARERNFHKMRASRPQPWVSVFLQATAVQHQQYGHRYPDGPGWKGRLWFWAGLERVLVN